jgi:membrane-bound metal-dependent hydrolase YbcI (DUF457 family)
MHHASEIIQTTNMSYTLVHIVTIIVHPLNNDIARGFMPSLAAASFTVIFTQFKRSTGHFESKCWLE